MADKDYMYYKRTLHNRWLEISEQFPVLLLTGPRQIGKTTFLKHISEQGRTYVTLDDPDNRLLAKDDPVLFFKRYQPPLLIDEIQYAPNLMQYIKIQVDNDKKAGMFWLTGSQQFQMMKGVTETLAGRVAIINMLGFSRNERHRENIEEQPFLPTQEFLEHKLTKIKNAKSKNVYDEIWQGGFPALVTGKIKDWEVFYSSYLRTYLERDVRDLAQVGNEGAFITFLKACAARTAQILNLTELARDADISVNTAKSWLSILQASFQIFLLSPFHTNITKRIVKRPKLYFLDTGLCSYLTGWTTAKSLSSGIMSGAILENYVLSEILKSWWHQCKTPSIYYYRNKDGVEMDFLLTQNQKFYPLEVKKAASPKKKWTGAFSTVSRLGEIDSGGILCLCKELLPMDKNIYAIPINLI
jgi:predicted AAA+ superfamily ATPase